MTKSNSAGCFKYGCFGCLAIVALAFGTILLLGALQFAAAEDPRPEQRQAARDLPPPPPYPGTDRPEGVEAVPGPGLADPGTVAGGVLSLDLRMGEFVIRPGAAGEPLRVEADFDASVFELVETFEESPDGGWTYDVRFGAKGGFFGMLLRGGGNNPQNRVEITVPRGHPMKIVGSIGMGESKVDLGGLWIQDVDLQLEMGDHFVEFREPLPFPMDGFQVEGSMGEIEIRGLGDASPERVVVSHRMGELFLDLQGAWRRDARVEADFGMGECRLWLPENARVELSGASVSMGEAFTDLPAYDNLPEDAPRITVDARGSMGELRVEH